MKRYRRWLLGLPLCLGMLYLGTYHLLYHTLPLMSNDGMSDAILSEARVQAGDHAAGARRRQPAGPGSAAGATDGRSRMALSLPVHHDDNRSHISPTDAGRTVQKHSVVSDQPDGLALELDRPPGPMRLLHGHVEPGTLDSAILGARRPFFIYLPPGYPAGGQRYPVLYLLHGAPGTYDDWLSGGGIDKTLDALISVGRINPLIAVLLDGNGGIFGDTEWANSGDGKVRVEDYVTREVVPYIDTHYRTLADRDHRLIGGLSTGGFGAVNITLHHPDVFGYALSLSGNYLAAYTWTGKDIWAGRPELKAYNSPLLQAPKVSAIKSLYFYLTTDASDNLDGTNRQTEQFAALLQRLKVPHRAQYFRGGHSWDFWRKHIVDALDYVTQVTP